MCIHQVNLVLSAADVIRAENEAGKQFRKCVTATEESTNSARTAHSFLHQWHRVAAVS